MEGEVAVRERLDSLNRRAMAMLLLVALPLDAAIYLAHYVLHPCWQFMLPVVTSGLMFAAWLLAFALSRRGKTVRSAEVAALSVVVQCAAVLMVRDRSLAICMLTMATATFYVAFFSRHLLVICAGVMAGSVLVFEVLDGLGVLPLVAPPPGLHRLFEGGFLVLVVPLLVYFVLERERIGRLPVEALQASTREQQRVLQAVAATLPEVDRLVGRLRELGGTLAAAASQQASTAAEVSASMDALGKMAAETSSAAAQTRALADSAREGSQRSSAQIVGVEEHFRSAIEVLRRALVRNQHLADESQRTGEIVEAIQDLDDQVGMLALNASIEASRAGESGRGFAVVAVELRRLMEESSERSRSSATILEGIRGEATVLAQEAETTANALGTHLEHLRDAAGQVLQIAESQKNAAAQVDRIAAGVEQLRSLTMTMSTAMRDATASAGELSRLAGELEEGVAGAVRSTETLRAATRAT